MSQLVESAGGSRRRPWVAAVLGFVWPGVGYLYAGRGRSALLLLLLWNPAELGILLLAVVVPVPLANIVIPAVLSLALRGLLARGAARAASGFGAERPVPFFSRWYACLTGVVVTVPLNLLAAHVYRTTFVEAYKIPTGSMEATILRGDHLLAVKWAYGWREPVLRKVVFVRRRPARGELVVFLFPEDRSRAFLMRLIGLPGETVEILDKTVLVNGEPLDEPYARFLEPPVRHDAAEYALQPYPLRDNWGPVEVPPDAYFVLGDNRDNSRDSRFWGFVEQADLLGRATVVYWSWDSKDRRVRWERIGRRLK